MDIIINSRFSFFNFFFLFFLDFCSSAHICKPSSCNELGPQIRFPFRIKEKKEIQQNNRCGYPGFDLFCNDQGQTILNLPFSGDFEVTRIDYTAQAIYINDPQFCLPKRISNFDTSGSKFRAAMGKKNYTFYKCSSDWISYMGPDRNVPLSCVGDKNFTVMASTSVIPSRDLPPSCIRMPNVSVPLRLSFAQYWSSEVFSEDIELVWPEPGCRNCEILGQFCGFSSDSGLEVACSTPHRKGIFSSPLFYLFSSNFLRHFHNIYL